MVLHLVVVKLARDRSPEDIFLVEFSQCGVCGISSAANFCTYFYIKMQLSVRSIYCEKITLGLHIFVVKCVRDRR